MEKAAYSDRKYNLYPLVRQGDYNPPAIVKAEGIYLFDSSGKEYIDLSSQYVNVNLGHGNKTLINAVKKQLDTLPYIGSKFSVDVVSRLSARIIEEVAPEIGGKVFFTLGGADANENAIKIARKYTGRDKVLSSYRSYHGSTYGAANLSGEMRRFSSEPGIPGFVKFFYPDYSLDKLYFSSEELYIAFCLRKLEEQIIFENPANIAAVFLETVIGSNGVIIPPRGYLNGIRKLCDRYSILMVCDEVMTGFFRTGSWFAYSGFDVVPDIVTFAKGITCGYVPLGGVIVDRKIASYFDDNIFNCTLTYGAHPAGCAAGIAAIDEYIRLDIPGKMAVTSVLFAERLKGLVKRYTCAGAARSIGLLGILELHRDAENTPLVPYGKDPAGVMADVMSLFYKNGLSTYHTQNMISVSPPLVITAEEIDEVFRRLEAVLAVLDEKYCN